MTRSSVSKYLTNPCERGEHEEKAAPGVLLPPFCLLGAAFSYLGVLMRLRDGKQECSRCHGEGCWHCGRKGYVVLCPHCACIEYIEPLPDGNGFRCGACGYTFDKAGNPIP
jgi:hypothetical protein